MLKSKAGEFLSPSGSFNARDLRDNPLLLLRRTDVAKLLGIHKQTVHNWSKSGKLPKPLRLTNGCVAWRAADLAKFLDRLSHEAQGGRGS